jgi:phosphohistidine phosphatase SixA
MLVGHNPEVSALCQALAPAHALPALETGMVCALQLETASWSGLTQSRTLEARHEAPRP